ncbi:hypothetical protein U1Q18_039603, partial [Sarracenia purpurea var. burkii]
DEPDGGILKLYFDGDGGTKGSLASGGNLVGTPVPRVGGCVKGGKYRGTGGRNGNRGGAARPIWMLENESTIRRERIRKQR